jgi:hypothetical protein
VAQVRIPVNVPVPELVYLPGHRHAVGEGVLRPVLHRVDEGLRPIRVDAWMWFAYCGALVRPIVAPPVGWRYCPICWDTSNAPPSRARARP